MTTVRDDNLERVGLSRNSAAVTQEKQMKTVEEYRKQIVEAEVGLATLSGRPLRLYARGRQIMDTPDHGAVLEVNWAVADQSYEDWYPTVEAAKAELLVVARRSNTQPSEDGMYVDLTAPGCHDSSARIRDLKDPS